MAFRKQVGRFGRMSSVRIALTCASFLLACSSCYADAAEFPTELRGFWVGDQAACDALKTTSPAELRDGERWLKIAATDILGTTQGRLIREISAQIAPGSLVKRSFEFQIANDFGQIAQFNFLEKGLLETMTGARTSRYYFKCF